MPRVQVRAKEKKHRLRVVTVQATAKAAVAATTVVIVIVRAGIVRGVVAVVGVVTASDQRAFARADLGNHGRR